MSEAASRNRLSGGCLCGAVRFTASVANSEADACHCSMCRRSAGGPILAVAVADLAFEDDSRVSTYQSSEWGERLFCPACGSNLAWRMRNGSHVSVQAYAFDPPFDPPLKLEIFIDSKPQGYAFAGETRKLTGAEVVAEFQAAQEKQHG